MQSRPLFFGLSAALVIALSCGDASPPSPTWRVARRAMRATASPDSFGWDHAVTTTNFEADAAERLGSATSTIAGNTLAAIVTDPDVRVRGDGKACSACH